MTRHKVILALFAPIWFLAALLAFLIYPQPVSISLFQHEFHLSLCFILIAELLIGYGLGIGHGLSLVAQSKQKEQRSAEWQAQDVKLVAEVKSDREKQLEAKIATLESALKQALKKV